MLDQSVRMGLDEAGEVLNQQAVAGQQCLHALRKTQRPDMALEDDTVEALKGPGDFRSEFLYKAKHGVLPECSCRDTHYTGWALFCH